MDAVVVEGVEDDDLKKGPGWDPRGVLPGMDGNVIIAAHNNIYGSHFRDLHQLKEGDLIYISKDDRKLTYRVESLFTIHESDPTSIFDKTEERLLTLITCAAPVSYTPHPVKRYLPEFNLPEPGMAEKILIHSFLSLSLIHICITSSPLRVCVITPS